MCFSRKRADFLSFSVRCFQFNPRSNFEEYGCGIGLILFNHNQLLAVQFLVYGKTVHIDDGCYAVHVVMEFFVFYL